MFVSFVIDIYIPEKSPSVAVKTSNVLEDRHELRVLFTAMFSLLSLLWLRLFFVVVVVLVLVTKKKSKFHSQKDLIFNSAAGGGMGIGDREDPLFGPLMQRSV